MKLDRVIISTTCDPVYSDGVKFVRDAWEKIGVVCTVIQVGGHKNDYPENKVDFIISPIEGVPDQNLAKLIRVILAGVFSNSWCLISDADMMPMNGDYFKECSEQADENSILYYTSELTGEDSGKFPACYMLAKGRTFNKYVNPNNLDYSDLIKNWNCGPMGNPKKLPFSDETVYRSLFINAPKIKLNRYHQSHRLCRSNWPDSILDSLKFENYIDCHLPRPASENMDKIGPVLTHLNLKF